MSFFDEISKIVDFSGSSAIGSYNILLVGGDAIYIDGIARIVTISSQCIVVKTKKELIEITGIELIVRHCSIDSIIISGKITNIHTPQNT